MKHFYVYYSYEEWGRGYIGRRECICHPDEDVNYFGSFKDKSFKPSCKVVLQIFNSREEAIQAEVELHKFFLVDLNPHFANRSKQTSVGFAGGVQNRKWFRNPESTEQSLFFTDQQPLGWVLGRIPESTHTKAKKSQSHEGLKHTLESKEKISKSNKGRVKSATEIEAIRKANTGRVKTDPELEAIRKALTGIKRSPETKAKMSEAQKGISKGKGVPKSPEHRRKIAEAMRGNKNRHNANIRT